MWAFSQVFVILTWLVCFTFFGLNVLMTCRTYFSHETIETISPKLEENAKLPLMAICSNRPFKNPLTPMLTLEDYIDNTYDPKNYILDVNWTSLAHNGGQQKPVRWKVRDLYTYFHGRCRLFEMTAKV